MRLRANTWSPRLSRFRDDVTRGYEWDHGYRLLPRKPDRRNKTPSQDTCQALKLLFSSLKLSSLLSIQKRRKRISRRPYKGGTPAGVRADTL